VKDVFCAMVFHGALPMSERYEGDFHQSEVSEFVSRHLSRIIEVPIEIDVVKDFLSIFGKHLKSSYQFCGHRYDPGAVAFHRSIDGDGSGFFVYVRPGDGCQFAWVGSGFFEALKEGAEFLSSRSDQLV